MPYELYCRNCNIKTAPVMPSGQRCAGSGSTAGCGLLLTLAPGVNITGGIEDYVIESIVGVGGMGMVYKTRSTSGKEIVVKEFYLDKASFHNQQGVLNQQAYTDELDKARRRFRREALVQSSINHRAFPAGYGYFMDPSLDNREFMAMEWVDGSDLDRLLTARAPLTFDEHEVLDIGMKVCDGLEVMHFHTDPTTGLLDALVHRDIKPANLILTPANEIKILDLGIARAVRQSAGTAQRNTQAGTPEYAMPEVVLGQPNERSDIGALAATMYHLFTGNTFPPLDWDNWYPMVDNDLPPTWRAIFKKALDKQEGQRHRDIREFRADLVSLLPAHLQPAQAIPVAQTAGTSQYSINWIASTAAMLNPNQYREVLAGQVVQGRIGVPGVQITPFIVDLGAGAWNGTRVSTNLQGDFTLATPDITVPATVRERSIEIIVEDPTTGQGLHRETVVIRRPANWRRFRMGAGIANAGGAIGHGVVAPFRVIGNAGRGIGRGVQGAAGAIGNAGRGAGQGIQKAAGWVTSKIRSIPKPSAPTIALLLVYFFALLTIVGLWGHWAPLWVICPLLAIWAVRIRTRLQNKQSLTTNLWRLLMPFASAFWLVMGLIFASAQ